MMKMKSTKNNHNSGLKYGRHNSIWREDVLWQTKKYGII